MSGTETEELLNEQSKPLHSLYQEHKDYLTGTRINNNSTAFDLLTEKKEWIPQFYGAQG